MAKDPSRNRASSRSSAPVSAHPSDQTIQRFFSALTRIAPDLPRQTPIGNSSKGKK